MKQMKLDEKGRIEFMLGCGNNVAGIARALGRSESTISRELLNRRIDSDKRYGCSNRLCARFDTCSLLSSRESESRRLAKHKSHCFEHCREFREDVCERLNRAPYVCNGCEREHNCPMAKKFYIASVAQAASDSERSLSRTGVHPNNETVAKMDKVISVCVKNGQSPMVAKVNNPGLFEKYAKSTIYGWFANGLFSAKKHDLPFAGTRKKPHKRPETKTDAKCRIGRAIREMWEWLKAEGKSVTCELDTVVGSISGKVAFTMIFIETGLALAFLRDRKSSQTATRLFNALWTAAGPSLFRKLFETTLTDNGPEFSDPAMIENFRPDPEHNPTKLSPRGIRVWFADPYCSSQKPHIENFHLLFRRILQKGTSFDPLDQEAFNLALSHINSYPRESTGWRAPYDVFVEKYGAEGKAFLDRIGIVRIPANEVTLHPFLLGAKYQKAADMAILRKNGVTTQKSTESQK